MVMGYIYSVSTILGVYTTWNSCFIKYMSYYMRIDAYNIMRAVAVRHGTVGRVRGFHNMWACWILRVVRTRRIILK